jgi:hypothetical protein
VINDQPQWCLLQDVGRRYPKWLQEHEGKIPPEEFSQHTAQLSHINAICKLLEEHGDSKFDELLKLLQEVRVHFTDISLFMSQIPLCC